jgi:hypothetical protein
MKTVSATLALLSALVPLAANATQIHTTGNIGGWPIDSIIEGPTYSDPDSITINGPSGREQILVTCSPFDWSSYGANNSEWVDFIARRWCF